MLWQTFGLTVWTLWFVIHEIWTISDRKSRNYIYCKTTQIQSWVSCFTTQNTGINSLIYHLSSVRGLKTRTCSSRNGLCLKNGNCQKFCQTRWMLLPCLTWFFLLAKQIWSSAPSLRNTGGLHSTDNPVHCVSGLPEHLCFTVVWKTLVVITTNPKHSQKEKTNPACFSH